MWLPNQRPEHSSQALRASAWKVEATAQLPELEAGQQAGTSSGPGVMRSIMSQASMQVTAYHRLLNMMSCSCRMFRRSLYSQKSNNTGPSKNARLRKGYHLVPMIRSPWPYSHRRHGSEMNSVNTAVSVASGQPGEEAPKYISRPCISTSGSRLRSWHVPSVCSTITTSLTTRDVDSA